MAQSTRRVSGLLSTCMLDLFWHLFPCVWHPTDYWGRCQFGGARNTPHRQRLSCTSEPSSPSTNKHDVEWTRALSELPALRVDSPFACPFCKAAMHSDIIKQAFLRSMFRVHIHIERQERSKFKYQHSKNVRAEMSSAPQQSRRASPCFVCMHINGAVMVRAQEYARAHAHLFAPHHVN
jgi:hypothetical protein